LAAGVAVYASAIVLSVCLEIPLWATILTVGVVTIIYDTIGGITAVVYSDVIQMIMLLGGIVLCIFYAVDISGGLEATWSSFPDSRRVALEPSLGIGADSAAPFWPFLLGGFFLYISYYGTDQSQVQRELSAASTEETKKSLLWNGLARFPLTVLYVVLGISLLAAYQKSPELAAQVPDDKPDYLVPQFVLLYIPQGVRALIFASLLAAAMSSLDSALNSLSASTMRDFIGRKLRDPSRLLFYSKLTTVGWGILITAFAFLAGSISETVIEAVNKVGSAFYGPILATFLVGILFHRTTPFGILMGLPAGVGLNLFLWLVLPEVHWMWWNCTGFLTTAAVAFLCSRFPASTPPHGAESYVLEKKAIREDSRRWGWAYTLLAAYFVLMLLVLYFI
jgi:SSS family solute:Na+ symporter